MLYEDYLVTDCGIRETKRQRIYFCELVGGNNYKINFGLIIQGCVGEKEYTIQYEAVAPHIHVGDLLHCEFAWQWQGSYLNLCLSGFLRVKVYQVGPDLAREVVPQDYLNPYRGCGVTTSVSGQWVRFPGLISCGGDSYVYTNFAMAYPELSSCGRDSAKGELVWKPKPAKQESVGIIRKTIGRFISSFSGSY